MNKLKNKPIGKLDINAKTKFERYNLKENPFPSSPFVNKNAEDSRSNGTIFEIEIREKEYKLLKERFLERPQSDPNHLRMGFLIDSSYTGRGNGKTAFLINMINTINKDFCMDISKNQNKCFSIYIQPLPSGNSKTFSNFLDLFFESIIQSNIISTSLAILRLDAMENLEGDKNYFSNVPDNEIIRNLNSVEWFQQNKIDINLIDKKIAKNQFISKINPDFFLFKKQSLFNNTFITEKNFIDIYKFIKKTPDKINFIFSDLVNFFLASEFNGAYIFIDDFERIPDWQSDRQKRDFSLNLRNCLYDGSYVNCKYGFFNLILVFNAGVPRLMEKSWVESGMENRVPINPDVESNHILRFEKINKKDAVMLIQKYLDEFRIKKQKDNTLQPFNKNSIYKLAEISELNAAKILKNAYSLLDTAASDKIDIVDEKYIQENLYKSPEIEKRTEKDLSTENTLDLMNESKGS